MKAPFFLPMLNFIPNSYDCVWCREFFVAGCRDVEGLRVLHDGEIKFDEKCKYDRLND